MYQVMTRKAAIIVVILICILAIGLGVRQLRREAAFQKSVEHFVIKHIVDWQRANRLGDEFRGDYVIISHKNDWKLAIGKVVLLQGRSQRAWKWDWNEDTLTEVAENDMVALRHCRGSWQFYTNRLGSYVTEVVIEAIYPRCNSLLLSKVSATWWLLDHENEPWSMTQRFPGESSP